MSRTPAKSRPAADEKEFLAMCWKCANAVKVPSKESPGAETISGCKEDSRIHSFADAQKLCPIREKLGFPPAKDEPKFNIYLREFFEGEEIKRTLLKDSLSRKQAVCLLHSVFEREIKGWEDKYTLVEKGFEFRKGYYFRGIPVGHDRCLRVEMVEAAKPLPEL